jgi:hypothetical protein
VTRWWARLWHLGGDTDLQAAEEARRLAEEHRDRLENKLAATKRDTIPRVRRATDDLAAEIERALGRVR